MRKLSASGVNLEVKDVSLAHFCCAVCVYIIQICIHICVVITDYDAFCLFGSAGFGNV